MEVQADMSGRIGRAVGALAVVVSASLAMAATASAQSSPPAVVTIVHGVRGLVADVYLDGHSVLKTFEPERTAGPLNVPAGHHRVDVRVSGAPATSPPVLSWDVVLAPGERISAVVHLSAAGQPTVTKYDDDVSRIAAGGSRLVFRHDAAAPPIDVRLSNRLLATGLTNPQQSEQQVGAGSYTVAVNAVHSTTPLAASQDVQLQEGTAHFLYLIGSAKDNTLGWIEERVAGLQSAPLAVQTGNSGLAATHDGPNWTLYALGAVGVLLLIGAVVPWSRRGRAPTTA